MRAAASRHFSATAGRRHVLGLPFGNADKRGTRRRVPLPFALEGASAVNDCAPHPRRPNNGYFTVVSANSSIQVLYGTKLTRLLTAYSFEGAYRNSTLAWSWT